MAFINDLFKAGWSTSKPGDMKNPSHMGMHQLDASAAQTEIDAERKRKQAAFAQAMSATTDIRNRESLVETIDSLKRMGLTDSHISSIADRYNVGAMRAQVIADLAAEAESKPNPDRPQTEVDAW